MRQNLAWPFGYKVAALPRAPVGLLNPVSAGAAMALSSVSVVANALRRRRFRAHRDGRSAAAAGAAPTPEAVAA